MQVQIHVIKQLKLIQLQIFAFKVFIKPQVITFKQQSFMFFLKVKFLVIIFI